MSRGGTREPGVELMQRRGLEILSMKHFASALALTLAVTALSACVSDYRATTGDAGANAYQEGYYDGYYGPFRDGYWGADGLFYYSTPDGHAFVRDDSHHFRRDEAPGYHHFRQRHILPATH